MEEIAAKEGRKGNLEAREQEQARKTGRGEGGGIRMGETHHHRTASLPLSYTGRGRRHAIICGGKERRVGWARLLDEGGGGGVGTKRKGGGRKGRASGKSTSEVQVRWSKEDEREREVFMQGCNGMNPDAIILPSLPSLSLSISHYLVDRASAPLCLPPRRTARSLSFPFLLGRCREWARDDEEEEEEEKEEGFEQGRRSASDREGERSKNARTPLPSHILFDDAREGERDCSVNDPRRRRRRR